MRTLGLASVSLASCIVCFAACGSDEGSGTPIDDAGVDARSSDARASSSSSSGSGTDGGPTGDDDDDAGTTPDAGDDDAGTDAGFDAGFDAGPPAWSFLPPSCKAGQGKGPGVNTCGATEAASDDCCKSLTLPATATRTLDKYEITAGRMRAFVDAGPNIRQFAKDYAAAHPSSQLGKVAAGFPAKGEFGGYLDMLPTQTDPQDPVNETLMLGAMPVDAINRFDGCYITPDGYGAATFWQEPADVKPYGIGLGKDGNDKADGTRRLTKAQADTKPVNCAPPIMLAAFCAWDDAELARTSDYHEVWHKPKIKIPGGATVSVPWSTVLPWSEFNWRNGHDAPGSCPSGWPGCANGTVPVFYSWPTPAKPADDDAAEIGAPGRFPKDVTAAVSPDGGGWFDIGGNLLESAWPNTALSPNVQNVCATSAGAGAGTKSCNRNQPANAGQGLPAEARPGTKLYDGNVPGIMLVGYSFEIHAQYGGTYLANATDDETTIKDFEVFPAQFQYGKVGGRCVRVKK